MCALHDFLRTL